MRKSKKSRLRSILIITLAIVIGLASLYAMETNNEAIPFETEDHQFYRTASEANRLLEVSFRKDKPLSSEATKTVQDFLDKYCNNKSIKLSDYSEEKLRIIMDTREEKLQSDIYFKQPIATEIKKEEIHKIDALDFNSRNNAVIQKYFASIIQK